MTWKRFEFFLSWVSIAALIVTAGYVGYVRMQPQSATPSDRPLFDLFLSSELNQDSEDPSVIIQPNELSDYLVPSSTQTITIDELRPGINLESIEIQSTSSSVH